MPKFKTVSKEITKAGRIEFLYPELVDTYKPFIAKTKGSQIGILEFGKDEDIAIGRKVLIEAARQMRKYIKVRKPRNAGNILQFERITAAEARKKKVGKQQAAKKQPKPAAKKKSAKKSG